MTSGQGRSSCLLVARRELMHSACLLPDLGTNAASASHPGCGKVTPGAGVSPLPWVCPGWGLGTRWWPARSALRPGALQAARGICIWVQRLLQSLQAVLQPPGTGRSRCAPVAPAGMCRGWPGAVAPRGLSPCPPREEGVGAPLQKPQAPRVGRRCMGRRSQADPGENVLHGICKSGHGEGPK